MHEGIVKEYFIIEVFEWLSEEEEVNFNSLLLHVCLPSNSLSTSHT